MTIVTLSLPEGVVDGSDLDHEGTRGTSFISIAIESMDTVATITTLAAIGANLGSLAWGIRSWAINRKESSKLVLKGRHANLSLELTPNVSVKDISLIIERLIELEKDE